MKGLTKLWIDLGNLSCNKSQCILTHRLFWQELRDDNEENEPIYLAINTLSGAIDLFTKKEGNEIEEVIVNNAWNKMSDRLYNYLLERGYIFQSKEMEELIII